MNDDRKVKIMKLHVGVFFGGKATEHEVSVISAIQAIENMNKDKYEIVPVYISKDEQFYSGPELLNIDNYKNLGDLLKKATPVSFEKDPKGGRIFLMKSPSGFISKRLNYFQVAFPILHGNKGENGAIQGMFETLDIPYVGSNVLASAIGMDKDIAKIVADSVGVPVVDFVAFNKYEYYENTEDILTRIMQKLEFPMIVKPASGGSSIGIEIAKTAPVLNPVSIRSSHLT